MEYVPMIIKALDKAKVSTKLTIACVAILAIGLIIKLN